MKIKPLSSKEIELITRLEFEGKDIYTRQDIASFCKNNKKAKYLIKKLLEKKRLRKIIKNTYLFTPMKAPQQQWKANEYLVAKALARKSNYYIGYLAVFNSYGFTDQVAQIIHVINDKYSIRKNIFGVGYKLIKTLPDRIYGTEKRKINGEDIVFCTKERAMIDVFEYYDVAKAREILRNQLNKLDMRRFIEYVAQYPVQTIRRRIGYLLEQLGAKASILQKIKTGAKGFTPLYNNRSKKGNLDRKWRIIING